MSEQSFEGERSLKILHVLRSPVGGLFRHVLDLARDQVERGHTVGLVVDSTTGGSVADAALADLAPLLGLGVIRIAMRRSPHPLDVVVTARVAAVVKAKRPDVVHGHGSKGGLYARLAGSLVGGRSGPARVYTPHGGSLHFGAGSPNHRLYTGVERYLGRFSDLFLFESTYAAERYRASIGDPGCTVRVALNGLRDAEFDPVRPDPDAADFLYVGELRALKGVDTFLDAFAAACAESGRRLQAVLVGSGPDRDIFEAWASRLGLADQVTFTGQMPARAAFRLGRVLVVPSRAESLPYIVLEAAAAEIPIVATQVGGIPEIFGAQRARLVPSDDPAALKARMLEMLDMPIEESRRSTRAFAAQVRAEFSIRRMVDGVLGGYHKALAARIEPRRTRSVKAPIAPPRFGL